MAHEDTNLVRVTFLLVQDADGHPPASRERLWARRLKSGSYQLDNVPFFAKDVSLRDVVDVDEQDNGDLLFRSVRERSGHSTIRVVTYDQADVAGVREALRHLGCPSELSHLPTLIAVDVPPEASIDAVRALLDAGVAENRWDYEESALAHGS